MSMTKADILHNTLSDMIDDHVPDGIASSKMSELLEELYDIAEGNKCNHRDSDECDCEDEKFHWYLCVFSNGKETGNAYRGVVENKFTLNDVGIARDHAGFKVEAVLLNCCYLGYMTRDDIKGDI